MTENSPSKRQISKQHQILIFFLICGALFLSIFFVFLCINENNAIEARYFARVDYAGQAIKNAVQVTNSAMFAYESRYDGALSVILNDFNESFVRANGDPDEIDLNALKQEYEVIHPPGVALYIIDSTNTIIASTQEAEIGYAFSDIPEFAYELQEIYLNHKAVLDVTTRNHASGEMYKYGYLSSGAHDYLLEVGIALPDLSTPYVTRYASIDPNIITTLSTVFLFSKNADLQDLGSHEQAVIYLPERVNYISRAFSGQESFSVYIPEEDKRVDYFFIPYPDDGAPSHSFVSLVLEVTTDITPLHDEIFHNTLFFTIIGIICVLVFISMNVFIIRFAVDLE